MIATLPMYTTSRTRSAYDRFWSMWSAKLRAAGVEAPSHLAHDEDSEASWTDPELVISQTCGYPYASRLRGTVRLVATPHYAVEGCDGPNYKSWIIVRADSSAESLKDLRGTRAAINGPGSQSGYNSFRAVIAPLAQREAFFSNVVVSGGHASSMKMVADAEADCATVDAVSWVQTIDENPDLERSLKRLGATPSLPGLPFVTASHRSDEELAIMRETLLATLARPTLAADLATLRISGASVVSDTAYEACLEMERTATTAGYPVLK